MLASFIESFAQDSGAMQDIRLPDLYRLVSAYVPAPFVPSLGSHTSDRPLEHRSYECMSIV